MDSQFTFLHLIVTQDKPIDIKEEASDQCFSSLSPPFTPSPPSFPSPATLPSTHRSGSTSSLATQRRHRPYPAPSCRNSTPNQDLISMSGSPYGAWSDVGARSQSRAQHHPDRRSSDKGDATYTIPQFMNDPYLTNMGDGSTDMRPMSSSSSLTGAMGNTNISAHSRHSGSPSSSQGGHVYAGNTQNHGLAWNTDPRVAINMSNTTYPVMSGPGGASFQNLNSVQIGMVGINDFTTTRNGSPESPGSGYSIQNPNQVSVQEPDNSSMNYPGPSYSHSSMSPEDELRHLRHKVRELEQECRRNRTESMRSSVGGTPGSGLPTHSYSATFQAGWKARTETRKRIYCSLNRAGNALCAWHDSRRERRAYPPRNAPAGYLNCGCTFEQALFEESLSRHGVGSYLPGETVRMDPALRNPLLKLLEERYGYKDGDFEHNPSTQQWATGESPADWGHKAQSGQVVRRRQDTDRH